MTPNTAGKLGEWFDAYAARLVLYSRNWLDDAGAEDIVQEVFLKLAAQKPPRDIAAWLFRAVRNASVSEQRARQRRGRRERQVGLAVSPWFESRSEDQIDGALAQDVLALLPIDQREIVVLRIWGGLTLAEAAGVTGEPLSTLHSRYQTALVAIKQKLERSCQLKTP